MDRFIVTYTQMPTNYNRSSSLVVEADSPADAAQIVAYHVGDLGRPLYNSPESGGRTYTGQEKVYVVRPYVAPPAGRVVGPVEAQ